VQIRSLTGFLGYACKPCRYRQVEDRIFICYRQADTLIVATNLERLLAAEFGDAHVFRDQRTLESGDHWPNTIEAWLRSSTAVLVLIGPQWLTLTDDRTGHRRIDTPDDQVRLEIELALDVYPKTRVIPVLVEGAQMPTRELPPTIGHLQLHHAAQVRRDSLVDDALQLTRRLRTPPPPRFLKWDELRDHPMGALVANALWRPLWSNLLLPVALLVAGLVMGAWWPVAVATVLYIVFFTVTLFDRQQVRCVEEGLEKLHRQRHDTHPAPAEPSGMP
jgi:hypothetical protein